MNFKEWPLALFTAIFQTAAGAAAAAFVFSPPAGSGFAVAVLALAALATLLSLFHLGRPVRSPRSIGNLGRSWLSREIVLLLTFDAIACALAWTEAAGIPTGGILAAAAAISGLACVFAMARIYVLPAVPDWNSWRTPAAFYATAFVLGGMAASVYFRDGGLHKAVLAVLLAALGLDILSAPRFGWLVRRATPLGFHPNPAWPAIFFGRLGLLALAALLWIPALVRPDASAGFSVVALGLAALSEIIGRLQFYDLPLGLSPRK